MDNVNAQRLMQRLPPAAVEAHRVSEALIASGVPCYVRCWHLGQTGWFVVHAQTYERLNFPAQAETMRYSAQKNRRLIEQARQQGRDCGCFFCGSVFAPDEVVEYTPDGSALCPNCDIDTVLVSVVDEEALYAGLARWFSGVRPPADQVLEVA